MAVVGYLDKYTIVITANKHTHTIKERKKGGKEEREHIQAKLSAMLRIDSACQ